ncbi:hypothetical protein C8R44DRAFT_814621 [Mycena epipterygia]|nr:hypothetical protein C8R44DRAFT_814621 [Mycena epipterygia]
MARTRSRSTCTPNTQPNGPSPSEAADPNGLLPHFLLEIRFSAPDDVWLSFGYGRRCIGFGSRSLSISASSF